MYCFYDKSVRPRHWIDCDALPKRQPKRPDHLEKELHFLWWDSSGVVFWELVPASSMLNSDTFCTELQKMSRILRKRRPRRTFLLLMDNVRPNTAKSTHNKKLEELEIELAPHPPYSPDLAPTDYRVVRSLQAFFAGTKFTNWEVVKISVNNSLLSKSSEFCAHEFGQKTML